MKTLYVTKMLTMREGPEGPSSGGGGIRTHVRSTSNRERLLQLRPAVL